MADQNDGNWIKLAGFGFEIAVGIGLGYLIGTFIDRKLGSAPWGLIVGVMFGCFAGMYLMIKEVVKMNRD